MSAQKITNVKAYVFNNKDMAHLLLSWDGKVSDMHLKRSIQVLLDGKPYSIGGKVVNFKNIPNGVALQSIHIPGGLKAGQSLNIVVRNMEEDGSAADSSPITYKVPDGFVYNKPVHNGHAHHQGLLDNLNKQMGDINKEHSKLQAKRKQFALQRDLLSSKMGAKGIKPAAKDKLAKEHAGTTNQGIANDMAIMAVEGKRKGLQQQIDIRAGVLKRMFPNAQNAPNALVHTGAKAVKKSKLKSKVKPKKKKAAVRKKRR